MAKVTQEMVDAAWLVVDRFATTEWAGEVKNLMQSAEMLEDPSQAQASVKAVKKLLASKSEDEMNEVIRAHKVLVKGERQGIYPKKTEDHIREAIAPILGPKKPPISILGGQ